MLKLRLGEAKIETYQTFAKLATGMLKSLEPKKSRKLLAQFVVRVW
jgi:hypothetical protein